MSILAPTPTGDEVPLVPEQIDPQYLKLLQGLSNLLTGYAIRFPSTNREEWFLYKSCASWPQGTGAYQWPCGTSSAVSIRFEPVDSQLGSDTEAASYVTALKSTLDSQGITYDHVVATFTVTTVTP